MIFRRKQSTADLTDDRVEDAEGDLETPVGEEFDDPDEALLDEGEEDEDDTEVADEVAETDATDWRADGPFDIDEVDLDGDAVERLDLGALIVTPWEGLGLQLQVTEDQQQVMSALAAWQRSGLQLSLLAAPTSGGLIEELRGDLSDEATRTGGTAEKRVGPFGPEVHRIVGMRGPNGERLYQESTTWFAEGPRWLLVGTLLGEAASEEDHPAAAPFIEFFRNVIVRRGDRPMVPGDVITLTLPAGAKG